MRSQLKHFAIKKSTKEKEDNNAGNEGQKKL